MDFVVEASAFEQQAGGSREGDRALFRWPMVRMLVL